MNGVYLIGNRSLGWFKIGQSTNINKRLRLVAQGVPFSVELVDTREVTLATWLERKLHQHFAAKRLRGEWFTLTPEEIQEWGTVAKSLSPETSTAMPLTFRKRLPRVNRHRGVRLVKRVKTKDGKWLQLAVCRDKNDKATDEVWFQGQRMEAAGSFVIVWRENGRQKIKPVGRSLKEAQFALEDQHRLLAKIAQI